MYSITKGNILLLSILFSITITGVFSDCHYPQITCYSSIDSWCCSDDQTCGSYRDSCHDSSDLPPAVIAIIIIVAIFGFVVCLSCCLQSHRRQQRLRATLPNPHTRLHPSSYQNNVVRGPVRVIHVRPMSHVRTAPMASTVPSIYEAPPPSYEVAVASSPSVHQVSTSPPVTATVEQSSISNV